ncbi:MAG: transcription-repair coupling factor, partial [Armatimonadetes bacterium]|nr:transcription-repair coupling factor [Armatimonadota bacterium]
LERPILVVTWQAERVGHIADTLTRLGLQPEQALELPVSQSALLDDPFTDSREIGERIRALMALSSGRPCVVIATPEAILQQTAPPCDITPHLISAAVAERFDSAAALHSLVAMGYTRATTVTRPGEFARHGGILDVFPGSALAPIRIDLFGDTIESIREFDVTTQRSVRSTTSATVGPAREVRMEAERSAKAVAAIRSAFEARCSELREQQNREALVTLTERVESDLVGVAQSAYFDGLEDYLGYIYPAVTSALDYLSAGAVIVFDEPEQCLIHADRVVSELQAARTRRWERGDALDPAIRMQPYEVLQRAAACRPSMAFALNSRPFLAGATVAIDVAATPKYSGALDVFGSDVCTWLQNACRVLICTSRPARVADLCAELAIPLSVEGDEHSERVTLAGTALSDGFKLDALRICVVTDHELFEGAQFVSTRRRTAGGVATSSLLDLAPGNYVIHIHHGVGLYQGLTRESKAGFERDYLKIAYENGEVFVPADCVDRVQRYVATEGTVPVVNRLGGRDWERTKARVQKHAQEMAGELLRLFAARSATERPAYDTDGPWVKEVESLFPWDETRSQRRAIADVKLDLSNARPMDRLICGDVGFGKTEVAVRAAMIAVTSGRQVAVLCPTTVLAAQHHVTFNERLAGYPVKIDLLSRFRTREQIAETVAGLADGRVDIAIGTHRLLSKDVVFDDLGLLIVDEEQRFGVRHKERIKQLRTEVDVLTLSATPIPRTLSMALTGIRQMSVISDAPEGRTPIHTIVRRWDDDIVADAILREMERGGQVYLVHNRVESIDFVAQKLSRIVPAARIGVGHGQMDEEKLERVMYQFYHHEIDVLLCTTIIENGLDIPNANTIIIDHADKLGLSQLHQLRGRVGRSDRQAYAFMMYHRDTRGPAADLRLTAIREFATLGSGYQLAMRDLEIRGAGDLFGREQSGVMAQVGFELFCDMVSEELLKEQGQTAPLRLLPEIDVPVTANIPPSYVPGDVERLYFYRQLTQVRTREQIDEIAQELLDRFGKLPTELETALTVLRMRVQCRRLGVSSIRHKDEILRVRFAIMPMLDAGQVHRLAHAFRGHRFTEDGFSIQVRSDSAMTQTQAVIDLLDSILLPNNSDDDRALNNGNKSDAAARLANNVLMAAGRTGSLARND